MKKKLLSVLAGLACALGAYAVPAMPGLTKVLQPDGTYVSVALHGDEFFHYTTTADGYTVERNEAGYYVYMQKDANGVLLKSAQVAHDATSRSTSEVSFLKGIKPRLIEDKAANEARIKRVKANAAYSADGLAAKPKRYDYENFRGLVILVEYNDCPFSRDDIHDVFTNMITQRHYQGVPSEDDPTKITPCTGSVRDYFNDNSMGKFDPEFDVVGPVKINYSKTFAQGTTRAHTLMNYVIDAANPYVNFADYDRDKDGTVDMVYFVFSGHGSNVSGNDSQLIWPHKSSFAYKRVDGVYMGTYACSTELQGSDRTNVIDGIGTICHEFSHVLGLMDEYDTDYDGSGGQSVHPGNWSVMAGGSYLNNSRTPVGYSLFQRYQAGFATPKLITGEGNFDLRSIEENNEGYRINSAVNKEFFLLENRRKSGWNAYLPGEGMLVFRVDSTNTSVWVNNTINCNPGHNYYELLRANPKLISGTSIDWSGDPFPGSGNVLKITNETTANLKSWTGKPTELVINDIIEDKNGVIHFSVVRGDLGEATEDFESMPVFAKDTTDVQGVYAKWNFSNAIASNFGSFLSNGKRAVGIYNNGYISTSTEVTADKIVSVAFTVWNSNSKPVTIHLYKSVDNGATWQEVLQQGATEATKVKAGQSGKKYVYTIDENDYNPVLIKIAADGDFGTGRCIVDDVTITYNGRALLGIEDVVADGAEDASFRAVVADGVLAVNSDSSADVEVYDASGMLVARAAAVDGSVQISLPQAGFYIVRQGSNVKKIVNN